MTKTQMPKPVLTRRVFHPSTGEVEQHLITTDQAEAYADARVRRRWHRLPLYVAVFLWKVTTSIK